MLTVITSQDSTELKSYLVLTGAPMSLRVAAVFVNRQPR